MSAPNVIRGPDPESPERARERVETARLILRPYEERDFDALWALSAHPATFRFSERGPMSSDEAWSRLLRHVGHWALAGYGVFAVEEKETGRFIGEAGLCDFRRGLGPKFDGVPEMTWSIAAELQGLGLATEAAEAALLWTEARVPARRTVCLIHEKNLASLRVAEKLGYRPFERGSYKGYASVLLERERS